jgi:hypothetical protein
MTTSRRLPTPWNVYNLTGSPYFRGLLEARRLPSVFVGRQPEIHRLRAHIRSAGENSSRQAIAGAPGVGKTTLVKELKALALADGYFTTDAVVSIQGTDTAATLFGRVLGALYDTIVANRPQAVDHPALQDARGLVRATRLGTGGGGISIAGVGANISTSTTVLDASDLMIDGPPVVRDLSQFVRESGARGVLLHLNSGENLTETDTQHIATLLRDLRDPILLQHGLHFVLVGTTDAIASVFNAHQQERNTVDILRLETLGIADVHEMLTARYAHRQLDAHTPALAPVEPDAVDDLYTLFRGDLRGLLKALEDGVHPLLGLLHHLGSATVRSATSADIRATLQWRYGAELGEYVEPERVEQLIAWGKNGAETVQTQKGLMELWNLSQPGVSNAVTALVRRGYVVPLPRVGAESIQYVLSGVSRLIFGEASAGMRSTCS